MHSLPTGPMRRHHVVDVACTLYTRCIMPSDARMAIRMNPVPEVSLPPVAHSRLFPI